MSSMKLPATCVSLSENEQLDINGGSIFDNMDDTTKKVLAVGSVAVAVTGAIALAVGIFSGDSNLMDNARNNIFNALNKLFGISPL